MAHKADSPMKPNAVQPLVVKGQKRLVNSDTSRDSSLAGRKYLAKDKLLSAQRSTLPFDVITMATERSRSRLSHTLWIFASMSNADIDTETVEKAKDGRWVPIPDSENEAMVLVVKARTVAPDKSFTYEKAEEYCNKDTSHLASISSAEEAKFISELASQVIGRSDKIFIGLRSEFKWADGTSEDFADKFTNVKKCYYVSFTTYDK
ncbi:lectin C-type domain protein [Ostertagia ostertagi]